jgi:hypothetical protein
MQIRIANLGDEPGNLKWEFDKASTRLPSLFDLEQAVVGPYLTERVKGRGEAFNDIFFDIPFTEKDPEAFCLALRSIVESGERYRAVVRYWTRRIDGESRIRRKLCIKGNFHGFYEEVLRRWEDFGFKHLADLARTANPAVDRHSWCGIHRWLH